jgi:phage repressor protein C with HTH and peptisase S24 domain
MSSIVTQRFIQCHNKLKEENRVRSSRQFAMALEYLPQSLSEILKGRRDVTIDLLRKGVEVYKMNPLFLYTGDGPLFMTSGENNDLRVLTVVTDSQDEERILHVPSTVHAGYALESGNANFMQQLPSFSLPDSRYKSHTHRSFEVFGDAMQPTLYEGDKVICAFIEPSLWESTIKDQQLYVVIHKAEVAIRRVQNRLKDGKSLVLDADNSFYKATEAKLGDIREIWQVRNKISPIVTANGAHVLPFQEELQDLRKQVQMQNELIAKLLDKLG